MEADKKNAKRLEAYLVFLDETGFLLIPPVRRTWAPRGRTPVVRYHQKRERISVIGGLSVSPKRQHIGLFYQLHDKNIQQAEVCAFLRHLLRHLHGPVIVLWDNGRPHKGELIRQFCRRHRRLRLEAFPPYAPELNPSEGVWSQAKETMANGRPDDQEQLWEHLLLTFADLGSSQPTLRSCFHLSELPPFLR
jgi:putative transposase